MRSEVLSKLLEETIRLKIDQLESSNKNQKEEISYCEKLVDDISKLMRLCNTVVIEEKPVDYENSETLSLKTVNNQMTRKDTRLQITNRPSFKTLEITKAGAKSTKNNNKNLSQDNLLLNPGNNTTTNKNNRNVSQKNFSTNTKTKRENEEDLKNLKSKVKAEKVTLSKTPKNIEGGDNSINIKPFNKYRSQKNIRIEPKTIKTEVKIRVENNGDVTPTKRPEKQFKKNNSVTKIDKERVHNFEKKATNPLIQSVVDNNNTLIHDLQDESKKTLDKNHHESKIKENNVENSVSMNVDLKHESKKTVDKNHLESNIKENEQTKKLDLNPIFIEKLKSITPFLSRHDLIKVSYLSSDYLKASRLILKKIIENEVNCFKEKVKSLNEKYNSIELSKEIPGFVIPRGTVKALEMLNESMYIKLFTQASLPCPDILWPYRLFFQFLQHPIMLIKSEKEFWDESCKFFMSDPNGRTGDLINNIIKSLVFTEENIYKVFKMCEGKEKKIIPSFYSKICGTTGLIIFLIRDALEYSGIIIDKRTLPASLNRLYSSGLTKSNIMLNKLNCFYEK